MITKIIRIKPRSEIPAHLFDSDGCVYGIGSETYDEYAGKQVGVEIPEGKDSSIFYDGFFFPAWSFEVVEPKPKHEPKSKRVYLVRGVNVFGVRFNEAICSTRDKARAMVKELKKFEPYNRRDMWLEIEKWELDKGRPAS